MGMLMERLSHQCLLNFLRPFGIQPTQILEPAAETGLVGHLSTEISSQKEMMMVMMAANDDLSTTPDQKEAYQTTAVEFQYLTAQLPLPVPKSRLDLLAQLSL